MTIKTKHGYRNGTHPNGNYSLQQAIGADAFSELLSFKGHLEAEKMRSKQLEEGKLIDTQNVVRAAYSHLRSEAANQSRRLEQLTTQYKADHTNNAGTSIIDAVGRYEDTHPQKPTMIGVYFSDDGTVFIRYENKTGVRKIKGYNGSRLVDEREEKLRFL